MWFGGMWRGDRKVGYWDGENGDRRGGGRMSGRRRCLGGKKGFVLRKRGEKKILRGLLSDVGGVRRKYRRVWDMLRGWLCLIVGGER